jgi:hypothetical protein
MFTHQELSLLVEALAAFHPNQSERAPTRALFRKVRSMVANGGLMPVPTDAADPNEKPPANVIAATVERVYQPLFNAIVNVYRALPPCAWADLHAGLGTAFNVVVEIAKQTEHAELDHDALARIAAGALLNLNLKPEMRRLLTAANRTGLGFTSVGGQA